VEAGTTVSTTNSSTTSDKIDISALMAMGDIAHGEKVFKKEENRIKKISKKKMRPKIYLNVK